MALRRVLVLSIQLVFLSLSIDKSFALIDYTEGDKDFTFPTEERKKRPRTIKKISRSSRSTVQSTAKFMTVKMSYDSLNVRTDLRSGKVGLLKMATTITTNYGMFMDLSYWQGTSSEDELAGSSSFQSGNPAARIGFNWLQFGNASELMTIDIYGGLSLKSRDSDFASSRTDQTVGLQTAKKIENFVLVFEGELRLTGNPSRSDELDIGTIRKLTAGLGVYVSPDIRFSTHASAYRVGSSKNTDRQNHLREGVSFATITPKLFLEVYPNFNVEMGAAFRTRRVKDSEDLVQAKLYDIPGAYGNTFSIGLNMAI